MVLTLMSLSKLVVSRLSRRNSTFAKRRTPSHLFKSNLTFSNLSISRRNAETSVQCPVEKGEYTVVHTVTLPKEIPPGTILLLQRFYIVSINRINTLIAPFNVHIDGYTVDDEDLVCLDLSIDFRKTPGRRIFNW